MRKIAAAKGTAIEDSRQEIMCGLYAAIVNIGEEME
jgi:hypothetical protein